MTDNASAAAIATVDHLQRLPQPDPDFRLSYGAMPSQIGDLRLPAGAGPHPVAILVHGGCWLAEYDFGYFSAFAAALASAGIATWNIEFRRIGEPGGGWPGTFEDVAAAADHVARLAEAYPLDGSRVISIGHSSGGHLALWLAARLKLGPRDPFCGVSAQALAGTIALAGIPDLDSFSSATGCGASIRCLVGDDRVERRVRLRRVSPIAMRAPGVPELLIIGRHDTVVPAEQARSYCGARDDTARMLEIASVGHYELVDPESAAWPVIRDSALGFVHSNREHALQIKTGEGPEGNQGL